MKLEKAGNDLKLNWKIIKDVLNRSKTNSFIQTINNTFFEKLHPSDKPKEILNRLNYFINAAQNMYNQTKHQDKRFITV